MTDVGVSPLEKIVKLNGPHVSTIPHVHVGHKKVSVIISFVVVFMEPFTFSIYFVIRSTAGHS